MLRVGVLGINHKLAQLKLREALAKACQKWFGTLQAVHENHYFILLSTCNRTELYFSSDDLTATHSYLLNILRAEVKDDFDHKLYSYFGTDCFNHLTRVTLGLDSAIIAETEIQGQVKLAYEATTDYHILPKDLHFLFQKAIGIAKKLRSDLQLGRGMPRLEHAILQTGKQVFSCPEKARLLFIGASEINQKILLFLKNRNFQDITLCNRSDDYGEALTNKFGVHLLQWAQLKKWLAYDWIIFGTKSPNYLITAEEITKDSISRKLVIDLCVPRNVDPKIGFHPKMTLLNIDEMSIENSCQSERMMQLIAEAEVRAADAVQRQSLRYAEKNQNRIAVLAEIA